MHPIEPNESSPARRKLLGSMVSAAALLGLNAAGAAASAPPTSGSSGPTDRPSEPEELFSQARLRNYKTRRSSSWDRTGANDDWVRVEPGSAATLLDVTGAGVVTHIWFTI